MLAIYASNGSDAFTNLFDLDLVQAPFNIDDYRTSCFCSGLSSFLHPFLKIDRVIVGADSVNQLAQTIGTEVSLLQVDLPDLKCEEKNLINLAWWRKI